MKLWISNNILRHHTKLQKKKKKQINLVSKFKTSGLKKILQKVKKQHREWEETFASYIYDNGLLSRTSKSYYNSIIKGPITNLKIAQRN